MSEAKGLVILILMMVAGTVAWEWSLWGECRETNSFWYCARVLGK